MSVTLQDDSCPFCNPNVQQSVFYACEGFLAICNIAPVLPGHSLIIPVMHHTSIQELDEKALLSFFQTAQTASKILMKAFDTDAFDWSLQEKPEAGQTIEHLHLHIVPRLKGDLPNPGDWYPLLQHNDEIIIDSLKRPRLDADAMANIVKHLRKIANRM